MVERARSVVVVMAVIGSAHCGPSDPTEGVDALVVPAAMPRSSWAAQWAEPESWLSEDERAIQDALEYERHAVNLGSSVTTSATAGDGSRYVAGTFSGVVRVGATVLTSHGGDDVFLARIGSDGQIGWARAVGSKGKESGAKVDFDDGRVKLVAMTDGAVDCGRGPLQTWSSEAFFLCTFAPDGTPIDGASFPTGRR